MCSVGRAPGLGLGMGTTDLDAYSHNIIMYIKYISHSTQQYLILIKTHFFKLVPIAIPDVLLVVNRSSTIGLPSTQCVHVQSCC